MSVPRERLSPPKSLLFDLRRHEWGRNISNEIIYEETAKAGDPLGYLPFSFDDKPVGALFVADILDNKSARIRVAEGMECSPKCDGSRIVNLRLGDKLTAWVQSCDGGSYYTLRISDLDQPPTVKPDDPKLIDAIKARAAICIDDRGSVQEVKRPSPPDRLRRTKPVVKPQIFDGFSEDFFRDVGEAEQPSTT